MNYDSGMDLTCLSVRNPLSYLICYGIKDVENKTWETDYRGRLYIHSSGRISIRGMPDFSRYPMPVIHEFDSHLAAIQELEESGDYIGFAEHGIHVYLKNEERQDPHAFAEYRLLSDVYAHYREETEKPFFYANAIIGSVELVEIIEDSHSAWAEPGHYHWVIRSPKLLNEPILKVKERSGLWIHRIAEG